MNNEVNDYFLGLDIGTDSVGWAVTDMQYHILRRKGKSLWGVRLFDAANTAAERRMHRTNRRRLQRRKQRLLLLQELFSEEMNKKDPMFFQRLKDSAFWAEDKTEKQIYSLFNDNDFTDVDYNKEFKTIYHLRKALLKNEKEYDIRLVYLALHHILKHRGHFLFNGDIASATSFQTTFLTFKECLFDELNLEFECDSESEFEKIIKDKNKTSTSKCSELKKICHIKKEDKQINEIFKLITGSKATLSVIFQDKQLEEVEHNKISFSESSYEEKRLLLEDEIQERTGIVDIFHGLYNWVILADILEGGEYNGQSFLSIAKVNTYEKHKKDLRLLKNLVKEYCSNEYEKFFKIAFDKKDKDSKKSEDDKKDKGNKDDKKHNYCAYIGKYKKNGKKFSVSRCTQEDFYKDLKKLLDNMPQEQEEIKQILKEIENRSFLPLQVNSDNGVIPYQVNKMELQLILQNAEQYLPFLKEKDEESGKTVSEKIVSLFEFRIPYYVGPLNTAKGENSWMIRKEGEESGSIRPWNFKQKVDVDKSAAEFIQRMTNQCTYLQNETVLPKYSLLYSEYMVLNELNNVKIRDEKISVELKQNIYNEVFKKYKQVTGKRLLEYLNSHGYDLSKEDLSGFDGNFKTSLSSYLDLKKIFKEDIDKYAVQQMAEDIILWITLYGDDSKMLRRVIRQNYEKNLSEEQIKQLSRLKFQGWGRLSKCFLTELEGMDCETGECITIIQGLRNTQNNLMQLLSQKYTFLEKIEESNEGYHIDGEINYNNVVQDVVASPSVKRAVWQTIQIVEEIKKIMGKVPKKIFVEMARSEEEKKRTTSRKDKLLELYKVIDKECKTDWCTELSNKTEAEFQSIKLFLYYTQMGMCMYSGQKIDLSRLDDATIWDRDHIYPQSKTKDDSLDNLVLVDRRINAKKRDGIIMPEIQQKMCSKWKYLKDRGLISDKKYERLTRKTPLTNEELAGFINRQLVETRQSSKVVATLLKRIYDESEIVYVKANAVSDFRKEKTNNVKVRDLNDYHHAKDAYLNIVVGNVYHTKFTSNPLHWLKKNPNVKYSLKTEKMFAFDLEYKEQVVWKRGNEGSILIVKNTLNKNDILFTRYAYCNKGGLFDENIVKAGKSASLVPIKKGMDTQKYGGYSSITPSHFMLVESKDKKGKFIRTIEAVPLYRVREFNENQELLLDYCKQFYGLKEPRIIIPCIKKNAKLVIDGFPMHLKGSTGKQLILQGAVQLCLSNDDVVYLKRIIKYIDKNLNRKDKKELLKVDSYMKITKEENIKLYNIFIEKLSNKIYSYRPANPKDKLKEKEEQFKNLSLEEQCLVLGEILHLFQCKPVKADLTLIEGVKNAGVIKENKNISKSKSVKLIYQSPTGLYEQVIDLLTV